MWCSRLLNSVSYKDSFNLSQHGFNDKYVIPPTTPPTTESFVSVAIFLTFSMAIDAIFPTFSFNVF